MFGTMEILKKDWAVLCISPQKGWMDSSSLRSHKRWSRAHLPSWTEFIRVSSFCCPGDVTSSDFPYSTSPWLGTIIRGLTRRDEIAHEVEGRLHTTLWREIYAHTERVAPSGHSRGWLICLDLAQRGYRAPSYQTRYGVSSISIS